MTLPLQDPMLSAEGKAEPSHGTGFFRTVLRERKSAVVGLSIIVFFVVLAIVAPYIAPYSVTTRSCPVYAPPSPQHWLGCDDGGIDMLSLLMVGGRISMIVGFAATLVAMVIGGGVGLLSGYFGGAVDVSLMRVTDYLLVIPDLVLMMVIADLWGASLFHVIIVIGILEWTTTARIIRAQVMSVRERVYVKRARGMGAGNFRIVWRHILPQVGPLLIANTVLTIAIAIYLETALAFLGLEDPTVTTWGTILEHAFQRTAISYGAWWAIVPDGFMIAGLIVGCFLFALDEGERFGLVGESGCGKTTTILALMGLLPPNASLAGEVLVDGRNILAGGEDSVRGHRWKDVAMVFQGAMNAMNPVKRIGWQIAEPMAFHGVAQGAAARQRAGELLELVGIPASAAERYPHELSGGMRQRASIAMALACQPKILLADEPTTALDVMVQAQILELLTGLSDDLGLALVLVTHDLPVVAQVCDRAAVMYAGEIVEAGPVEALYHEPGHPYTRLLFAATPDLYGEEEVVSIPGAPPRLDREITGCPFRPRCDSYFDPCAQDHPVLKLVAPGHHAACHLTGLPASERAAREGARPLGGGADRG